MPYLVIPCAGCKHDTTTGVAHEHHVIPQAAGGKAGPTVWLCANCHNLIHRLGEAILHNKAQAFIDQLAILHPGKAAQDRLMGYAMTVADEMRQKREGQRSEAAEGDPNTRKVVVEVPLSWEPAIRSVLTGLKHPGTQRNLGLPTYLRQLLLGHLRDKGLL